MRAGMDNERDGRALSTPGRPHHHLSSGETRQWRLNNLPPPSPLRNKCSAAAPKVRGIESAASRRGDALAAAARATGKPSHAAGACRCSEEGQRKELPNASRQAFAPAARGLGFPPARNHAFATGLKGLPTRQPAPKQMAQCFGACGKSSGGGALAPASDYCPATMPPLITKPRRPAGAPALKTTYSGCWRRSTWSRAT